MYRRRDVESLLLIRELLYEDKFTIDGARRKIKEDHKKPKKDVSPKQLEVFLWEQNSGNVEKQVSEAQSETKTVETSSVSTKVKDNSDPKVLKKLKKELEDMLVKLKVE